LRPGSDPRAQSARRARLPRRGALHIATGSASATTVSDEAGFRTAWTDPGETRIDLDADIGLSCDHGGVAARGDGAELTLNGGEHTIRQTCPDHGVLVSESPLVVEDVTVTGGDGIGVAVLDLDGENGITLRHSKVLENIRESDSTGGGVFALGPIAVTDSTVSGNGDLGGVAGGGEVTVENSTVSDNAGVGVKGGRAALPVPGAPPEAWVRVKGSQVTDNLSAPEEANSGGVVGAGPLELVSSTVSRNTGSGVSSGSETVLRDAIVEGNEQQAIVALNAGLGAVTVSVTDSRISANGALLGLAGPASVMVARADLEVTGSMISGNDGGVDVGIGGAAFTGSTMDGNGGGIAVVDVDGKPLDITDTVFTRNDGGISGSAVTVENSMLSENSVAEDELAEVVTAIVWGGDVRIEDSSIRDNESGIAGFSPNTDGQSVTLERSTVEANGPAIVGSSDPPLLTGAIAGINVTASRTTVANNRARGIDALRAASLENSTVSGNVSARPGGGIATPDADLVYSTVVGNSAPGAANIAVPVPGAEGPFPVEGLQAFGSVVALPQEGVPNCLLADEAATSSSFSFSDDESCALTGAGDVENGGDPLLGRLAAVGGPTRTRQPLEGSPLLDVIPNGSCAAGIGVIADQRGRPRPAPDAGACDIGAVEIQQDDDMTPPDTELTSGPADGSTTEETGATFTYAAIPPEEASEFECALDGGGFEECPSDGIAYSDLATGAHAFAVRAVDKVGRVDPSPASVGWTVTPKSPSPGANAEDPDRDTDVTCRGRKATIVGTSGDDSIRGTPGRDVIAALGGDDVVRGLAGNDIICGGGGADRIRGDGGADRIYGGRGSDRVSGGDGNDKILNGRGRDVLRGDAGDDLLFGGRGDDRIFGGEGDDRLFGGPGIDRLVGGPGTNVLRQ